MGSVCVRSVRTVDSGAYVIEYKVFSELCYVPSLSFFFRMIFSDAYVLGVHS